MQLIEIVQQIKITIKKEPLYQILIADFGELVHYNIRK